MSDETTSIQVPVHNLSMFEPHAKNINAALAKAQGQMKPVIFDRVNPHYNSKFASLAAFIENVRIPFADNGLSFTHTLYFNGEKIFLCCCTLRHVSGECIVSVYPLPLNAKPQELGSALTYAKRYTLAAIAGVAADEDDDAEIAEGAKGTKGTKDVKEDTTPISPEEVLDTADLMEAVGADVPRVLDYCSSKISNPPRKVARLAELTASEKDQLWGMLHLKNPDKFNETLNRLNKMRERMAVDEARKA